MSSPSRATHLADTVLLPQAVEQGNFAAVTSILQSEPALATGIYHTRFNEGATLLHHLCINQQASPAIAELLIAAGADVNSRLCREGQTPLMLAAWRGNTALAEVVLRHGADPNLAAEYGRTPLDTAVMHCHQDIIDLLVRAGAACTLPHLIAARRDEAALLLLETHPALLNEPYQNGYPNDDFGAPLHVAVANDFSAGGNAKLFSELLQRGADLRVADREGRTPLQRAAWSGNREYASALLEHGALLDIFSAVALKDLQAVTAMLQENPALVHTALAGGLTPLMWAARTGSKPMVELLLRYKPDVNVLEVRDDITFAPLIQAMAHLPVARQLLEYGADPNLGHEVFPPLVAAARISPETTALLLQYGADPNLMGRAETNWNLNSSAVAWAAEWGDVVTLEMLVQKGVDFSNPRHSSVLHRAAMRGHGAVVSILLQYGCPRDAQDKWGQTARECAALAGQSAVVALLSPPARRSV